MSYAWRQVDKLARASPDKLENSGRLSYPARIGQRLPVKVAPEMPEEGVAQKEGKCGTATISYDEACTWICACAPKQPCVWSVTCPKNGGETTTSGEGLEINGHTHPTVTIDGNLKVVAAFLSKRWDRPVSVPSKLARKRVQRTLSGTQRRSRVLSAFNWSPRNRWAHRRKSSDRSSAGFLSKGPSSIRRPRVLHKPQR